MRAEIPNNDALMMPILRSLEDGIEHAISDTFSAVASMLELDDAALGLRTSGHRSVFEARVGWARWDLHQAGLIDFPRRGFAIITERGREAIEGRPEGIDRIYLRQFPEYDAYIKRKTPTSEVSEKVSLDDAGIPISDEATKRNVWIEKTIVQGRPDRVSGEYALGKALWSPLRDKGNKDIYHFMRDVRPGDIILHLTDNRGFTGVSIATSPAIETIGVRGTDWEGPAYLVTVDNFTVLGPTLPREVFFSEPFRSQLVDLLKGGLRNAFYNEGASLNQGAYLTPAPPDLVSVLNDAYRSISGKILIDVSTEFSVLSVSAPITGMTFAELQRSTFWSEEALNEVISSISGEGGRRQIVLAGPPGTGKTYVAMQIVRYLTQDDISRYRIVQFHQSYAYEQFVEGLRPTVKAGGIQFAPVPGVVLEMAELARKSALAHYLIIDEMNRANLQRVFGELMFLLEYRDQSISLPYTKNFSLPDNLYFIGTMNTADRSIRNIDLALRRRFEVFECAPSAEILRSYYKRDGSENQVADLIPGFEKLNELLAERLDEYHTIGHSFFMVQPFTHSDLRNVWRRRLRPLLQELFFDEPEKLEGLSMRELWPSAFAS